MNGVPNISYVQKDTLLTHERIIYFTKHTQRGYSMALEFGIPDGVFLYQFAILNGSVALFNIPDKGSCKGCSKAREMKRMYK